MILVSQIACNAGVFWTRDCSFSNCAAILDLITVEGWGEKTFPDGIGDNWPLRQSFTGQISKMTASKTRFVI